MLAKLTTEQVVQQMISLDDGFNSTTKTNSAKDDNNMSKNTINFEAFLNDLRDLIDTHLNGGVAAVPEPTKTATKPAAKVDKAKEEVSDDGERAKLLKTNIRTLRKQAIELGFDDEEVAEAEKEDLVDSILEALAEEADNAADTDDDEDLDEDADDEEADDDGDDDSEDDDEDDEDEDDEEEDDDEEEEDEEESDYTREDLEELTLTQLKKVAKEEFGESAASLKGLDTEQIIDLILGEEGDGEDDEDDEEGLSEDDLLAMSLAEVKTVAKENGVKVKPGMKKQEIIDALFA